MAEGKFVFKKRKEGGKSAQPSKKAKKGTAKAGAGVSNAGLLSFGDDE